MRTGKRYILENLKLAGELQDSAGIGSGTSMKYKLETDNNKKLNIYAVGLSWD